MYCAQRSLRVKRGSQSIINESNEVSNVVSRSPDWDLVDLDKEAREEDLRHEDGRRRLHGRLGVAREAAGAESGGGRGHPGHPQREDVQDKVALEPFDPVGLLNRRPN